MHREMQRFLALAMVVFCAVSVSSCKTKEQYSKNRLAGQAWLAEYTTAPAIDVAGHWIDSEWGGAILKQHGNKITGSLGHFAVHGKASGKTAYLLISENDWIYYTAKLTKPSHDRLVGHFSYGVPFRERNQTTMLFKRF